MYSEILDPRESAYILGELKKRCPNIDYIEGKIPSDPKVMDAIAVVAQKMHEFRQEHPYERPNDTAAAAKWDKDEKILTTSMLDLESVVGVHVELLSSCDLELIGIGIISIDE